MQSRFPHAFVQQSESLLGAQADAFFAALQNDPVVSVRKNPFKRTPLFENEEPVQWCHDGFYLGERPSFTLDPYFHAGAYYVQESSSMFLDHVFRYLQTRFDKPLRVLDLCAAPGGKSTLLSSLLGPQDLLVSNEIIRARVNILEDNMARWGQINSIITQNDPRDFAALKNYFDVIVVDAPCSGEGMFRKDEKAIAEWSPAHVALCAGRQQRILSDVIDALRPGGFLVYSTCTFNTGENEENVAWMQQELGLAPVHIPVDPAWPVQGSAHESFRFLPHRVKGEGLFMACLQKTGVGEQSSARASGKSYKPEWLPKKQAALLNDWLDAEAMELFTWNGQVHAIAAAHRDDYLKLAAALYIRNAGVQVGELIHDKLVPAHALALSNVLGDVPAIEVSKEEALTYLRKNDLRLPQQHKPGIYLLRYEGLGIGWVKVLQGRINNYLPNHLRVLKQQ